MKQETNEYNFAYYIKFKRLNLNHLNRNKRLPKYSQAITSISQNNILSNFDSNGNEITILFTTKEKIKSILLHFEKENLILNQKDITSDILTNKFSDSFLKSMILLNKENKALQKFYINNLTIDDILDKINMLGIKNLTLIDKLILREKALN